MDLGLSYGIRLHFELGLLDAILLDLHRKPRLTVHEELLGAGVRPEPLAATEVSATRAKQELGTGLRELELAESRDGQVTATLHQRFDLRTPVEWRLQLDARGKLSDQQVTFELPNKVSITVQATAPCTLERSEVRVALPEGSSEITLTITSKPVFDVSDTIIVCRPDQIREAAIVASCLPADHFTPILAIAPPPMPEADYIAQYKEFYRSQEGAMGQLGGAMGRAEALSADTVSQLRLINQVLDMRERRFTLTPYRSWVKHNEMVSALVSQLGIERAVFLHDFTPEELTATDPGPGVKPASRDGKEPGNQILRMFEGLREKHDLSGVDLFDLGTAAWRLLNGQDSIPSNTIEIAADDTAGYVAALFTALRTGAVLCAAKNPKTPVDALFAKVNPDAEEAVLVEDTGDTVALLGALYAHHRSARLVITPRPALESVQHTVAEHQSAVVAGAQAIAGDAQTVDFADALERYLSDGDGDPYAAVEAAVTAQVPSRVIAEVGERRLTAFTTGLPYSFVRTGGVSWARKPIGHVTGDADLIILNELYSAGVGRPGGTFSLVFDPGFFTVSETTEVMRSVGAHFTHPILLSGPDANMFALIQLPRRLPVELIFFNTHGSDDEIMLAGAPLHSSSLVQWLAMGHRPIVFNNSCQSWTGVGREFMRVGARGYIGTLWSIPTELAASFARIVVDRLTAEEELACEAIVNTSLSDIIERSYLYVGTANGRLDQWRDRAVTIAETALIECALLADAVPAGDEEQIVRPVLREIRNLRRLVKDTPYEWTLQHASVLLSELSLIIDLELPEKGEVDAALALAKQVDEVLERSDAPAEDVNTRHARRFGLTGSLYERFGAWAEALADYRRSVSYGEACRNRSNILIRMANTAMWQGQREEALQIARSAYKEFKEKKDRTALMAVLGLLGQLSKRLQRFGDAMDYAKEGYALAVELEDRDEQAIFKLDESFLYEMNGDLDGAIDAATTAVELARIRHNDRLELSSVGRLGVCYREKGDLEAAERYALLGLAQAERLEIPKEVATFHHDIGSVLTLKGHEVEALPHYREAVTILGNTGSWELAAGMVAELAQCGYRLGDAETLWLTAIWGSQFCEKIEQSQWLTLVQVIVAALKKALEIGPSALSENAINRLAEVAMSEKPDEQPAQMRLLGSIVFLTWKWMEGSDQTEVISFARHLDEQTNGVLSLAEFVSVPYGGRAR